MLSIIKTFLFEPIRFLRAFLEKADNAEMGTEEDLHINTGMAEVRYFLMLCARSVSADLASDDDFPKGL